MDEKAKVYRFGKLGGWVISIVIAVVLLGALWALERLDLCDLVTMGGSIALYHGFSRRKWKPAVGGTLLIMVAQSHWWVALWPYTQIP